MKQMHVQTPRYLILAILMRQGILVTQIYVTNTLHGAKAYSAPRYMLRAMHKPQGKLIMQIYLTNNIYGTKTHLQLTEKHVHLVHVCTCVSRAWVCVCECTCKYCYSYILIGRFLVCIHVSEVCVFMTLTSEKIRSSSLGMFHHIHLQHFTVTTSHYNSSYYSKEQKGQMFSTCQ